MFCRSMNMAFGMSSCSKMGLMTSFISLLMSWRIFCFTELFLAIDFKLFMLFSKEMWFSDYLSRGGSTGIIWLGDIGSIPTPDSCESISSLSFFYFSFSFYLSFSFSFSISFYYNCISNTLSESKHWSFECKSYLKKRALS